MTKIYSVSDLVSEFLARCGVTTAFGIVSVHNIPLLEAIGRNQEIRFVCTRGEAGASHMVDGYARASQKLGVLITSTGPGAANAVTGLVEARFAGTPLLHITGQTSTKFVDRALGTVHDVSDQLGMLQSVSKAAYRVRSPQEALGTLTRAVTEALSSPTGPVSVEIPIDIQRAPITRPAAFDSFQIACPQPLAPSNGELDQLVDIVTRSKRPMLWLGRGASQSTTAAEKLLELGFGMVTSAAGRGVVTDDHPMNLGPLNGNGIPAIERFYSTVDLMLVVGSRLRGHETGDFSVQLPTNLVQIDVDPQANGRTYPNKLFLKADAATTLSALAERIAGRLSLDPAFGDELRRLKQQARAAFAASLGPYKDFANQLRAVTPRDAIWARDITISNTTWGNKLFPIHTPNSNLYPIGAGIGQGFCLGLGAAIASNSRKVVILTGDGGFYLSMTELWTAVQEHLNVTIIVMNDGGYGVIRHIQDSTPGAQRRFDTVLGPDLEQLAALAGIPYWRVDQSQDFGRRALEAIGVAGPSLVEVDMTAIGEHPPYFPYGPKVVVPA